MSNKRRRQLIERAQVRQEVLERDGGCVWLLHAWEGPFRDPKVSLVGAPTRCAGPLDVHEVIPRSAWAGGYLVPSNCVTLCRTHHTWVTDNPSAAHSIGLHGYSYERPDA
jgi:hypothetical protein